MNYRDQNIWVSKIIVDMAVSWAYKLNCLDFKRINNYHLEYLGIYFEDGKCSKNDIELN